MSTLTLTNIGVLSRFTMGPLKEFEGLFLFGGGDIIRGIWDSWVTNMGQYRVRITDPISLEKCVLFLK